MATEVKRRKRKYGEINGEKVRYAGCLRYVNNYTVRFEGNGNRKITSFSIEKYKSDENAKEAAIEYANKYKEEKKLSKDGRILKEEYYEFQIMRPKRESKKFYVRNFTSKEEAEHAALTHQMNRSNALRRCKPLGEINISVEDQRKMAAWVDGDGCIHITRSKHPHIPNTLRYQVSVSVAQSCDTKIPSIIKIIQERYAGRIYTKPRKGNVRKIWEVKISENIALLESLEKYCALKYRQATLALACSREVRREKCDEYYQDLKRSKKLYVYETIAIDRSRITPDWIGSFFDAEGTVGVYHRKLVVSYAQKSSQRLLKAIEEYHYERCKIRGIVYEGKLKYNGRMAAIIVDDLLSVQSCIIKRPQLELAKRFMILQKEGNAESEEEKEHIVTEMKRLKRL